tara:strand:- start:1404 stop:1712 length:309 start_codon:yes stop_codon:yes gene_type:complete
MDPIKIKLSNTDYAVSWGNLAKIRYSGLSSEVTSPKGVQQVAVMLWCCIAEKPNPFPTWEHLADHMDLEKVVEYSEILTELFPTDEKKSTSENGPSPESTSD